MDVHLINEVGRRGAHRLRLEARMRGSGEEIYAQEAEVQVEGGEVYGQLLHGGFEFAVAAAGVIGHGKGKVVLICLPSLLTALEKPDQAIHRAVARRRLGNAIRM